LKIVELPLAVAVLDVLVARRPDGLEVCLVGTIALAGAFLVVRLDIALFVGALPVEERLQQDSRTSAGGRLFAAHQRHERTPVGLELF
jgi:hypothetical protein